MRKDGREDNELRPITLIRDFTDTKGGSVLIRWGNTRVLCTALLEEGTMPFLKGTGKGWLTAEYAMLPSSTGNRKKRDYLKQDGRSTEIQRLIGRSLRAGVDLNKLGERVIYVDCDVLQADGGTRTASITGAYVAVALGVKKWLREGRLEEDPMIHRIAAVSVGIVNDRPMLDLCYGEDSAAQVDMNLVMDETGAFIEVQGTGEGRAFSRAELDALLSLGESGVRALMEKQRAAEGVD
ncbi:MAG: ribonuclease PH [Clostridia bacterium]|nr:ribonuclease PH [Clostridia bacterium]MBQ6359087.1 ribonuclease PH [Clostridia bacterium]MBQ7755100.1 ribonuclease PH [Clostridia bacterium]MBR0422706.1 ribonuclease PH [Clostridia bacterium]